MILCTLEMINSILWLSYFLAEIYLMYGVDKVSLSLNFSRIKESIKILNLSRLSCSFTGTDHKAH